MGKQAQHRLLVAAACAAALGGPAAAAPPCRIALSLALDVSSSVDDREYALQAGGMAAALRDPDVAAAFLAVPGTIVALHIFEWSGEGQQRVVLDWTAVASAADLDAIAALLETRGRSFDRDATALGEALRFGARALAGRRDCAERVLDVSGDGEANDGVSPRAAKRAAIFDELVINGLVIGVTRSVLRPYYEAMVIQGPGAFVEMAEDHGDFRRAMRRKLIREVEPKAVADGGDALERGALERRALE